MGTTEERIAELAAILPRFIGVLLDGCEINSDMKLNDTEEKTLIFLHRTEGCPMTEYSKKLGLTRGSFTSVTDHLVQKGLVQRTTVCNDRRKFALILTEKGKEIAKQIDSEHTRHIAKKISKLDEKARNELKNALEVLEISMERLKEGNEKFER